MSREIKFRAWHKNNEKMLLFPMCYGVTRRVDNAYLVFGEQSVNPAYTDFYDNTDSYEIQQYTGLKDKNDKEIYEGDVVTLWNGLYDLKEHYVVRWYQFGFDYSKPAHPEETHYFPQDRIEVIGNIYENKDLI